MLQLSKHGVKAWVLSTFIYSWHWKLTLGHAAALKARVPSSSSCSWCWRLTLGLHCISQSTGPLQFQPFMMLKVDAGFTLQLSKHGYPPVSSVHDTKSWHWVTLQLSKHRSPPVPSVHDTESWRWVTHTLQLWKHRWLPALSQKKLTLTQAQRLSGKMTHEADTVGTSST